MEPMPKKSSSKQTPPTAKKATTKKVTSTRASRKAVTRATVADRMSRPVHRIDASASLSEAARLMWEQDIGVVPVTGPGDRVEGIVTDRDIAMAAYLQGRTLQSIPVRDVMSTSVQWVRTDEPVDEASSRMAQHQIRRLPVMDGEGSLVGMLSLNDLAEASADPEASGVTEHDVADILRAVSTPRTVKESFVTS
jgi:CBS domain-containing protein